MFKYTVFVTAIIIGYFIAVTPLINSINEENNLTQERIRMLDK